MERTEAKELLRQLMVPVILGNGLRAHLICLRLFFSRGVRSVICGRRAGLLDALNPLCDFFRLYSRDSRLTAEQLSDLSDSGSELIMPLILADSKLQSIIEENEGLLESRFIICHEGELEKLLSGADSHFASER